MLSPFDQGTSGIDGLSRSAPTPIRRWPIDDIGRIYLAWAERGYAAGSPRRPTGDARIVISTSTNGNNWTAPVPIADEACRHRPMTARGHQLMPSLAFAGGKLMLVYYDLRETRRSRSTSSSTTRRPSPIQQVTGLRHTIDIRASMAIARRPPGVPAVGAGVRLPRWADDPKAARTCRCRSIRRTCRCSSRAPRRSSATTSTSRPRRR